MPGKQRPAVEENKSTRGASGKGLGRHQNKVIDSLKTSDIERTKVRANRAIITRKLSAYANAYTANDEHRFRTQ